MHLRNSQAGGPKGKGKARAGTGSKSPKGDSPAEDPSSQDKRKGGKPGGGSGQKGRPPSFPPAPEIVKGSRVELQWDHITSEAVVLAMGTKDKEGLARVQWAPPLGAEPLEDAGKEWKSLDELRPAPPDPPKQWLYKLRGCDVVEAALAGAESWVEASFDDILLPETDTGGCKVKITVLETQEAVTLPEGSIRPLWYLNRASSTWSLIYRRSGPRASTLLTLKREGESWALLDQVTVTGAEQPFSEGDDAP